MFRLQSVSGLFLYFLYLTSLSSHQLLLMFNFAELCVFFMQLKNVRLMSNYHYFALLFITLKIIGKLTSAM